ncbi:MAG: hypothetical protein NVSMB52_09700 [Chloroflexota bacterium]
MMSVRLHPIFTATAPLAVATLIGKLWLTGKLGYYVNNRTVWIVLVGGALFAAVGLIALRSALTGTDTNTRFTWKTAAFLAPALVGLIIPAHPLSALSGQSSSLGALQLASHVASGPAGDAFGSWITDVGAHPDESWWAGQHVTLVGFTAEQAGMQKRSFIVGRYLVTCCVVDATLLGFPVQIDRGNSPPPGSWVQVSGVFGGRFWTDLTGSRWPMIVHAHLAQVSVPSSPYLSP